MSRSSALQSNFLFNRVAWLDVQQEAEKRIRDEIQAIEANRFLNTAVEDLVNFFVQKELRDLPRLSEETEVGTAEIQIDISRDPNRYFSMPGGPYFVPGTKITATIEFEGDGDLLNYQPVTFNMNPPQATLLGHALSISIEGSNLQSQEVKSAIDSFRFAVNQHLSWLAPSITNWNNIVSTVVRQAINERRSRLLASDTMVSALGFKVKVRDNTPRAYAAPAIRRKVTPVMPQASTTPYKPEPALPLDEYDHILGIMHEMALVMERSPTAFQTMGEEAIRTQFLVSLNSHYEGQATGETFNGAGKTDILVRVDGRNVFIAECKFWGGPKILTETIDQILSYATWRDTKLAVVIFNRNRNFGAVLDSITPTVEAHVNFKRTLQKPNDTSFRFIMAQKDDRNREMTLTVLSFDVPQPVTA